LIQKEKDFFVSYRPEGYLGTLSRPATTRGQ
jgi:hypothetical protein